MKKADFRTKQCFTIIELLVVIGVIAILVSILLPALNRAREKARQIQCAGNLKQIGSAVALYVDDYSGWFPISNDNGTIWAQAIAPYLSINFPVGVNSNYSKGIFICPSDQTPQIVNVSGHNPDYVTVSYGYNSNLQGASLAHSYDNWSRQKNSQVKNPSHKVFFADSQEFHRVWDKREFRHSLGDNILWGDIHVSWEKAGYPPVTNEYFIPDY
ncbi:MAG: type II secretion system protein [Victivallaceae bacterium]|nr:type II secretion system protein [Victivallaceae bacterium]